MNAIETEREALEARLAELNRPVLLKIGGKPQKIVGDGKLDNCKRTYQGFKDGKTIWNWIPAIPIIEVEDAS